jgi:chloramphenicol 3-O-phosphotransferase
VTSAAVVVVLYGPKAAGKSQIALVLQTEHGAWDSDWQLADDLEAAGIRVLRIWISAPLEVTLDRLAGRASRRAPMTAEEARWIWTAATEQSLQHRFELVLDTGDLDLLEIRDALAPLIPLLARSS